MRVWQGLRSCSSDPLFGACSAAPRPFPCNRTSHKEGEREGAEVTGARTVCWLHVHGYSAAHAAGKPGQAAGGPRQRSLRGQRSAAGRGQHRDHPVALLQPAAPSPPGCIPQRGLPAGASTDVSAPSGVSVCCSQADGEMQGGQTATESTTGPRSLSHRQSARPTVLCLKTRGVFPGLVLSRFPALGEAPLPARLWEERLTSTRTTLNQSHTAAGLRPLCKPCSHGLGRLLAG